MWKQSATRSVSYSGLDLSLFSTQHEEMIHENKLMIIARTNFVDTSHPHSIVLGETFTTCQGTFTIVHPVKQLVCLFCRCA